jgi:hypothetical protein
LDTVGFIQAVRKDVAVFRACVSSGVEINDNVLNGLWRAYIDVDVPLPLKPFTDWVQGKDGQLGERDKLVLNILEEMDTGLAKIEEVAKKSDFNPEEMSKSPEAQAVNALWRELVGCYAELANREIQEVPDEYKEEIIRGIIENLTQGMGMTLHEAKNEFKVNNSLRLSLRKSGINPDLIN